MKVLNENALHTLKLSYLSFPMTRPNVLQMFISQWGELRLVRACFPGKLPTHPRDCDWHQQEMTVTSLTLVYEFRCRQRPGCQVLATPPQTLCLQRRSRGRQQQRAPLPRAVMACLEVSSASRRGRPAAVPRTQPRQARGGPGSGTRPASRCRAEHGSGGLGG